MKTRPRPYGLRRLRDPEVAPAPASCSSVKTPTGRRSWLPAMLFILWMDTSHSWHRYAWVWIKRGEEMVRDCLSTCLWIDGGGVDAI